MFCHLILFLILISYFVYLNCFYIPHNFLKIHKNNNNKDSFYKLRRNRPIMNSDPIKEIKDLLIEFNKSFNLRLDAVETIVSSTEGTIKENVPFFEIAGDTFEIIARREVKDKRGLKLARNNLINSPQKLFDLCVNPLVFNITSKRYRATTKNESQTALQKDRFITIVDLAESSLEHLRNFRRNNEKSKISEVIKRVKLLDSYFEFYDNECNTESKKRDYLANSLLGLMAISINAYKDHCYFETVLEMDCQD